MEFVSYQLSTAYVCSFSLTHKEPLLWSHYADGHKGICLEIENSPRPQSKLLSERVEYSNMRPTVTIDETIAIKRGNKKGRDALRSAYFKKSYDWQKEAEYRIVARGSTSQNAYPVLRFPEGAYFRQSKLKINSVYFGSACTEQKFVLDLFEQKFSGENFPSIYQAKQHETEFGIYFKEMLNPFGDAKPISDLARALLEVGE
jgi:hypothetical protein